jgi:hypothetical protein
MGSKMTIKLLLSNEQLNVLNSALIEMPFKIVAPLIQNINAQIQKQFDDAKGDDPTGQTTPKDEYAGS